MRYGVISYESEDVEIWEDDKKWRVPPNEARRLKILWMSVPIARLKLVTDHDGVVLMTVKDETRKKQQGELTLLTNNVSFHRLHESVVFPCKSLSWTIILLVYVGSIVDLIGLTNTNDKRSRDRYNVELRFKGYYISAGQTSLLQVQ